LPPLPESAAPAPAPLTEAAVQAPEAAEAELSPDSGGEFEKKLENSEENAKVDEFYELKEYTKNSTEIVSPKTKSRLRKVFPTLAACMGVAFAIAAGLLGLCFRRKRKKGAGKNRNEKKRQV
jgi:hypothetical protein